MPRDHVAHVGEAQWCEAILGMGRDRGPRHCHVVSPVVEHGAAGDDQAIGAPAQQRDPVGSGVPVAAGELVDVVAAEGTEHLGQITVGVLRKWTARWEASSATRYVWLALDSQTV